MGPETQNIFFFYRPKPFIPHTAKNHSRLFFKLKACLATEKSSKRVISRGRVFTFSDNAHESFIH